MNEMPEVLVRYLEDRSHRRQAEIDETLAALTERERLLVRDAAIMGYVRGALAAGGIPREQFPNVGAIIADVISATRAHADLYPTLGKTL